ncbi:hypothetical protein BCR43DRAFT_482114 [Syncephalastrum racemosum]|uniref:Short-chain dehydrogenase n=1 Tax=Syncephalastrum racemosum TaxID=13706 RepID=A0A1X2HTA3_SYNRA|nr:hypothetical protein BCR43DRAFT_482114 [Syncephalastrum racemosum]
MPDTILITGATNGLGRAAAQKLLAAGHTVVVAGRNQGKLTEMRAALPFSDEQLCTVLLDLENPQSVRDAAKTITQLAPKLNVVVNNAGTIAAERTFCFGTELVEKTVAVNAVAPLFLTLLLLPVLKQNQGRVLFVTSSLHDPKVRGGGGDPQSRMPTDVDMDNLDGNKAWHPMQFYKISKLAQIWTMRVLAQLPEVQGVHVAAFCPGFVPTTDLNRSSSWFTRTLMHYILSYMPFAVSEDDAANDYVYYITTSSNTLGQGRFFQGREAKPGSDESRNMDKAYQFWNMACDISHTPEYRLDCPDACKSSVTTGM